MSDSLERTKRTEYENLIEYVEKSLSANRDKLRAMKWNTGLAIIVALLALILIPLGAYAWYAFRKRKIERLLQHERLKNYRGKMKTAREKDKHELDTLREKLKVSSHALTDMQQEMLQTAERLSTYKEEMEALRKKLEEFRITDLQKSECYNKFRDSKFLPQRQDFMELQQVVDDAYNGFTSSLKDLCPDIRDEELWVCCMIKIDMSPTEMCRALSCKANYLSMMRKRLYKKVFKEEGSATAFDAFIKET